MSSSLDFASLVCLSTSATSCHVFRSHQALHAIGVSLQQGPCMECSFRKLTKQVDSMDSNRNKRGDIFATCPELSGRGCRHELVRLNEALDRMHMHPNSLCLRPSNHGPKSGDTITLIQRETMEPFLMKQNRKLIIRKVLAR